MMIPSHVIIEIMFRDFCSMSNILFLFIGLRVIRFLAMALLDPSKLDDIIAKLNVLSTKFIQEKTFYSVAATLFMHHQNLKDALRILHQAPHGSVEA